MRWIAIGIALIVVALVPASALAKELRSATVCGANGCVVRDHPPQAIAMSDAFYTLAPARTRFIRVRLQMDSGSRAWTVLWLPRERLIAYVGEGGRILFDRVGSVIQDAFRAAARGRTPLPAPSSWTAAFRDRATCCT